MADLFELHFEFGNSGAQMLKFDLVRRVGGGSDSAPRWRCGSLGLGLGVVAGFQCLFPWRFLKKVEYVHFDFFNSATSPSVSLWILSMLA